MAKAIAMESTDALLNQDQPQEGRVLGMVRIGRGNQQQWIWPVHLPGWLALGWQVAHPAAAAACPEVVGRPGAPEQEQTADAQTASAVPNRRRGRKAKAVDGTDSVDTATSTSIAPDEIQELVQTEPLAAIEEEPAQPVASAEPTADAIGAPSSTGTDCGFALPDDLLNAQF